MDGGKNSNLIFLNLLFIFYHRIYLGWLLSLIFFVVIMEIARGGAPSDDKKPVRVSILKE